MELLFNPITLGAFAVIILIYSAILHEIAHGYVADRLGDPTARLSGRLTLNPLPHIDPMMSVLFPIILLVAHSPVIFGGAKPVPIDPFNLKGGRKDIALVSLAGPLTNILLAVFGSIVFRILLPYMDLRIILEQIFSGVFHAQSIFDVGVFLLVILIHINLSLAIFNLLPIPPLDGSKIFALLLPKQIARSYLSVSTFGIVIIFLLFSTLSRFIAIIYSFTLTLLGF